MKHYVKKISPIELEVWQESFKLLQARKDSYHYALEEHRKLQRNLVGKYFPEYSYLDFYTINPDTGIIYEEKFFE